MKRTTLILGFALLIVAVTLAATITLRNDPRRLATRPDGIEVPSTFQANQKYPAQGHSNSRIPRSDRFSGTAEARAYLEVSVPDESLAGLTPEAKGELLQRAEIVQREARQRLERMTEEFALTQAQRRKMFPVLARSTPQYDPSMQVGGTYLPVPDTRTATSEEVHDLLDSDQQESLEDKELDRQLWWEDIFTRLDQELVESTGGGPLQTDPVEGEPAMEDDPSPGERAAPTSRGGR